MEHEIRNLDKAFSSLSIYLKSIYIKSIFHKILNLTRKMNFIDDSMNQINKVSTFGNIIFSILIHENVICNNVFTILKKHNRKLILAKKIKIDNLVVSNNALVNREIEQRIPIKQSSFKMLNFYNKLFLPIYKDNILYIKKYLAIAFESWRDIVLEEKQKVIEEVDNIFQDNKIVNDKINLYKDKLHLLQIETKKLRENMNNCENCLKPNNNNDFNYTYSAIKDETLNKINLIPEFQCNFLVNDKPQLTVLSHLNNERSISSNEEDEEENDAEDEDENENENDDEVVDYNNIIKNVEFSKLNVNLLDTIKSIKSLIKSNSIIINTELGNNDSSKNTKTKYILESNIEDEFEKNEDLEMYNFLLEEEQTLREEFLEQNEKSKLLEYEIQNLLLEFQTLTS